MTTFADPDVPAQRLASESVVIEVAAVDQPLVRRKEAAEPVTVGRLVDFVASVRH